MTAFSNLTEAAIVDHFLRGQAQAASGTLYLALFTADPGESGYTNECTYQGYERRVITFSQIDVNGNTSNDTAIYFPANQGNNQTVAAAAVLDSEDAYTGNLVIHGAVTVEKTLELNDLLSFAIGGFVLNIN